MAGKSDEELHRRLEDQAWPHRQNHVDPTPEYVKALQHHLLTRL